MGLGLLSCLKKILGFGERSQGPASQETSRPGNGPAAAQKPGSETSVLQPAYTVRLKPEPGWEEAPSPKETARPAAPGATKETLLSWCGLTDTGMVRDHNEDYFSCTAIGESVLFVVADGMGGHDAGEVASKLAVETVCKEIGHSMKRDHDPLKLIERALQKANGEVVREGTSKGSNMGTTLNAALVIHDTAYVASVGDSRVYWIENGSIRQITEDHSLVAKLVSVGKLSREEARNHPKSNLLYRTIGSEPTIKVDTFQVGLKKGGSLLLCTDGLWGEVADDEIYRVCSAEKNVKSACVRLIRLAKENGGRDNITAVVVKVE
jgi:protein phosphatase